jgi:hypothetical protein
MNPSLSSQTVSNVRGGRRASSAGTTGRLVAVSATSGVTAQVSQAAVAAFKDRRRKRRVDVPPMYSSATVRVFGRRTDPMEGHVLNLSETGVLVELDDLLPIGQAVALEFTVAGLGLFRNESWPSYALAGEVIRIDDFDDFPQGPYKIAVRFERVPTIVQAQIARYVMNTPVATPSDK